MAKYYTRVRIRRMSELLDLADSVSNFGCFLLSVLYFLNMKTAC